MLKIQRNPGRLVQDGRVEGCVLTPSCKSTGITTNCWTIIDRKTLELTKKYDTPHPKKKEKPQWDGRRGEITIKLKPITAGWVTQTGEQLYHRSPPTGVNVLSPMSGFPTWGSGNRRRNSQRIWLWRLTGFDCRTLSFDSTLRVHTKSSVHIRTQGEGTVTP